MQRVPGEIKDALPALVPLLKEGVVLQRRQVATLLGRTGPEAVPTLIDLLKDNETAVRAAAAGSLAIIGPDAKKAVPTLSDLALDDKQLTVRRGSVIAVMLIEPAKLNDLFARVKKHGDDKVRSSAYQVLSSRAGKKGPAAACRRRSPCRS